VQRLKLLLLVKQLLFLSVFFRVLGWLLIFRVQAHIPLVETVGTKFDNELAAVLLSNFVWVGLGIDV